MGKPLTTDLEAWDKLEAVLVREVEMPPRVRTGIHKAQATLEGAILPGRACCRQAKSRRGWGWLFPAHLRRRGEW